ncbi:41989_t:CDS:2, partial [Gigaspora margarita]
MEKMTGKCASVAALWRSLKYCRITYKKLHKAAQERNECACSTFIAKIGECYTRDQLIFINESAKDERSLIRYYGYSSVNTHGIIAVDIIDGSCDRKQFVDFILDQ